MPRSGQHHPLLPPRTLVEVGVVVSSHGRDGAIRVLSSAGDPSRFRRGARLFIAGRDYTIDAAQPLSGGRFLLKLSGVHNRAQASALGGVAIEVDERDLPEPPPDAYYHYQLIGMTVADGSGVEIGTLAEIVPAGGANDVYVVTADCHELLLPAIGDVILNVDIAAGRMTVAVPEGLEWRALAPPGSKISRRKRREA